MADREPPVTDLECESGTDPDKCVRHGRVDALATALAEYPEIARKLQAVIRISLCGPFPQVWTLDFRSAPPRVEMGSIIPPDVTVAMDRQRFLALLEAKHPQAWRQAYLAGEIEIRGHQVFRSRAILLWNELFPRVRL